MRQRLDSRMKSADYLQTRGLSRRQALGLLTVGYIMPITELFEEENIRTALKDEIYLV